MTYDQRHNINILQPERHWLMPQGIVDFGADVIASNPLVYWNAQELTGSVLGTTYSQAVTVPDTRSVALVTYGDYVAGANWANSSAQIARHTAGSTATLQQDDILAAGKTYQATITLANRTAGSVTITDGGAAISANEQTTRTITSTGTDFIITPTTDFDGDIDVAIILVQQTGILASSAYPGAQLYVTANAASDPNGNEADATTGWATNATLTSDSVIKNVGGFSIKGVFAGASAQISFDLNTILTVGKRYKLIFDTRHLGSGGLVNSYLAQSTAGTQNLLVALDNTDTTFQTITKGFVHDANSRYLNAREVSGTNDGGVYFDNISLTEVNPLNGDDTGTALGTPTGTNLGVARTGDATTSYIKFYSAELNSMLSWLIGSFIFYGQSNTWAAGVDYFFNMSIDANNGISAYRTGTDIVVDYQVGGVSTSVTIPSGSPAGWFQIAFTWLYPGNLIVYYQGVQSGTPQAIAAPAVGNLDEALVVWMALNDTPSNVLDGSLTQLQPLYDRVLPVSEILAQKQGAGI